MQTERSISRRDILFGTSRSRGGATIHVANHCLALSEVACRACEDACAVHAIRFKPRLGGVDLISIDADACTRCGECQPVCPVDALRLKEASPHE